MSEFDYVVIGGGSAGCVVAGRLTEDPGISVCLIEAGGSGAGPLVTIPAGTALMVPTKLNNWSFETVPQPGLNGRRSYQPRGRALGGSSTINAMIYTRGHRWDYDHWASLGNVGWSFADVLPYFRRSENNEVFQNEYHGVGGPLNVANLRTDNPFHKRFLEAVRQLQLPVTSDFNGEVQEGLGIYQVTQKNGERWSVARAYIHPHLRRANLHVITRARARRILVSKNRAHGVEVTIGGEVKILRARSEVILSAGALQSPQLLMLSGIGSSEGLRRLGIEVVHNLPGVGRNLQDHIDYEFVFRADSPDLFGYSFGGLPYLFRAAVRFYRERRGILTTNFAECGGFLKTDPVLPVPDVQIHFLLALADDHGRRFHYGRGYSCRVCLLRPKSRGSVTLATADPSQPPLIDPNFLAEPDDIKGLVRGFKLARRIIDAPALKSVRTSELYGATARTDDEIGDLLRKRADTIYHPVGTCRMGIDSAAVVDPLLRVHGIQALRVIDASIMPTLIGGNTNAATIMIAERAVDLIRSARASPMTSE